MDKYAQPSTNGHNTEPDYSQLPATKITLFNFTEHQYTETKLKDVEEWSAFRSKKGITWINIDGFDRAIVEKLGALTGIHPLTVEDILNKARRPKAEAFDHYTYLNLKMLDNKQDPNEILAEQVNIIFGTDYVITIQEDIPGDVFDPIRERIRSQKGKICKLGADYLVYALVDMIVDNYYAVLENISESIEQLEEELLTKPTTSTLHTLHKLKLNMFFLKKSVWPLREALDFLKHEENPFIQDATIVYFRDIYDHTIQIIDQIETHRDILASMIDIYLSSTSNKLNIIMKRLTVIMTIFMPLTVLSGIGGMSEWSMITGSQNWPISYPLFIGGLILTAIGTYFFLKWKGWI